MKIVIVEGFHEADYIIGMYNKGNNNLIVINSDREICNYLSEKNDISVLCGKPTKETDLQKANIENADLFIALSQNDVKNYVSCILAKEYFNVKRCIATVINPKNVEVFKKLGVDSVLSSTYLLAQQIESAASVENLISSLSLEDSKIAILELQIHEDYDVCGKTLSELSISSLGSVSCLMRQSNAIIPNGSTMLLPNDRVLLVTSKEQKEKLVGIFQTKKNEK